ncbi:hypothetical protein SDC9_140860 [bioreactor metagenome]|uniref:Uncharacterized protein n=1 Tax=bioreactor metagenome TaxID=1076179 RepID=A0A645DX64_9ZZZZ
MVGHRNHGCDGYRYCLVFAQVHAFQRRLPVGQPGGKTLCAEHRRRIHGYRDHRRGLGTELCRRAFSAVVGKNRHAGVDVHHADRLRRIPLPPDSCADGGAVFRDALQPQLPFFRRVPVLAFRPDELRHIPDDHLEVPDVFSRATGGIRPVGGECSDVSGDHDMLFVGGGVRVLLRRHGQHHADRVFPKRVRNDRADHGDGVFGLLVFVGRHFRRAADRAQSWDFDDRPVHAEHHHRVQSDLFSDRRVHGGIRGARLAGRVRLFLLRQDSARGGGLRRDKFMALQRQRHDASAAAAAGLQHS